MKLYSVILAGGGGTRFWPLSREELPKQILNISGNDIMINETINRFKELISYEATYIVTNQRQKEMLTKVLHKSVPIGNILVEPEMRNTAPCILLAAMKIYKEHGDGVMSVFPADHYISDNKKYIQTLGKAAALAETTDNLVTIGIEPTYPSTGYGYIQYTKDKSHFIFSDKAETSSENKNINDLSKNMLYEDVYNVIKFVEKPDFEKARNYIESKDYFWNSGMFIWKISTIIDNFKRYLPRLYNWMLIYQDAIGTNMEEESLKKAYKMIQNISIDYGIMERSNEVLVVAGDFGWNDIGSWDSLGALFPPDNKGNIVKADLIELDTQDSIIYGQGKLIATIGLKNMIIVNTKDALLICPKNRAQEVKEIVNKLKKDGRNELI